MSKRVGILVRKLLQTARFVWASPYTILGLVIGGIGVCTGGHARIRGRTVEFYGGGTRWFVRRLPHGASTLAFTLGHTILGQTAETLDRARPHELIHVRQFERWGPFMGPAYVLSSLVLWMAGRNWYRDNPFEREAYGQKGRS